MRRSRSLRAASAIAMVLAIASCTNSPTRAAAPPPTAAPPKVEVLVAVGSDATFGDGRPNRLTDTWPQVLYHQAFPRSAILVNASYQAVTVDRATLLEVPLAIEQHATVVAVWLGDSDLEQRLPPAAFELKLTNMVRLLRASGARVLLGNLTHAKPGAAAYDDAIASVARTDGATLVDLAAALSATPRLGPSSLLTPKESAVVATAFGAAIGGSA